MPSNTSTFRAEKCKKKVAKKRHDWGSVEHHSDHRDGDYSTCKRCGAIRFLGDRYAYGKVTCR